MSKILIADDSSFMRRVLKDLLVKNGYTEIIEAGDGNEVIEKFELEKPELILSDLIMPEKDGIKVLEELVPRGAKVLMVSAVGQDEMIKKAEELGALGYVVKPFDEGQVIEAIKKALE